MMTREQARQLVAASVCGRPDWLPDDDEIIILDEHTIERDWGWVFFHTSKKWHETGDITYAIFGNAPLFVERLTGKLFVTGTGMDVEHYIDNYERTGSPHT